MIRDFLITLLLLNCITLYSQHHIIYGDTIYMEKTTIISTDLETYEDVSKEGYKLKENALNGFFKIYFKEDTTRLWLEGNLKNGKRIGKWEYWRLNGYREKQFFYSNSGEKYQLVIWTEDGNKEIETMYLNDHFDGPIITWYPNGQMHSISNYLNHKPNGTFISWHQGGLKASEKFYVNGFKRGTWKYWDEHGVLIKKVNY